MINNDKGMSLIQVMLASAISIGVAMGIMQMNKSSQKTMRKVKSDSDLISFKTNLQSQLGDKTKCENILAGKNIQTDASLTNEFQAFGGGASFTVGEMLMVAPGFDVREAIITQFTESSPGSPVGECSLEISLERNNQKNSYGGKHIAVKVPMTCEVENNPGDFSLKTCFSAFAGGGGVGGLWQNQNDVAGNLAAYLGSGGNPRALVGDSTQLPSPLTATMSFAPVVGQNWSIAPNPPTKHAIAISDRAAITFGSGNEIGLWKSGDILHTNKSFEATDTIIAQNELSAPRHWAFNYFFLSDERFKKEITPIENALDIIDSLDGVSYFMRSEEYPKMKFSKKKQLGVIAQQVEKVLPEIVSKGKNDYKSVEYNQLIPVLIESVKELRAEINKLKSENELLKAKIK